MKGFSPSRENRDSMMPVSVRVLTAEVMFMRPENSMPNPITMRPTLSAVRKGLPMMNMMPPIRASGARVEGLKNWRNAVR